MMTYYILEGKTPVQVDLMQWATWYESASRRVDETRVGDANVSTVFLGLDHSWGDGPPQLFETMIFGGDQDQEQWRYATWDEAQAGHDRIVAELKAGGQP